MCDGYKMLESDVLKCCYTCKHGENAYGEIECRKEGEDYGEGVRPNGICNNYSKSNELYLTEPGSSVLNKKLCTCHLT